MGTFEISELHEWGVKVSRLFELIALTRHTIKMHQQGGNSTWQIQDYEYLLSQHEAELSALMETYGLKIQIDTFDSAA